MARNKGDNNKKVSKRKYTKKKKQKIVLIIKIIKIRWGWKMKIIILMT